MNLCPYKVTVSAAPPAPRPHPRATPQVEEHRTEVMEEEIEEQPEEEVVQRIETGTVPASSNSRWSNLEVSYVDFNSQMSHSCAYEAYVKRCRETPRLCAHSTLLKQSAAVSYWSRDCGVIFFLFLLQKTVPLPDRRIVSIVSLLSNM